MDLEQGHVHGTASHSQTWKWKCQHARWWGICQRDVNASTCRCLYCRSKGVIQIKYLWKYVLKGKKNNLSNSPPPCADLLLKIQNTVLCCSHLLLCYCLWRHESKYLSWHFITLSNSVEICHSGRDLERWLVQVSAEGYKKVNISYLQVYKYIWEYNAASKKLLLGVKVLNWIPGGTNFYPICSLYQCTLYLFVYFKTSADLGQSSPLCKFPPLSANSAGAEQLQ